MKRIDKIRQMSSEELAKVLVNIITCRFRGECEGCWLAEAEECSPYGLVKFLEEEVQE